MSYSISGGLTGIDMSIIAIEILTISGEFEYLTISSYIYDEDISGNTIYDISTIDDYIYSPWVVNKWNKFTSMYVLGSIDTSGGDIYIRQGSLYVGQSINDVINFYNGYPSIKLNSNTYISDIPYEITVENYNFELPVITTNTYIVYNSLTTEQKTALAWIMSGSTCGITNGTSGIRGPLPYPSGVQCAYIGALNYMYKSFYLYAGNYKLSFYIAIRAGSAISNNAKIYIDTTLLATILPTALWVLTEVEFSVNSNADYIIKFQGDYTTYYFVIDNISITRTDLLVSSSQIGYLKNLQYDVNNALITLSSNIYTSSQQDNFKINNIYSGLYSLSGIVVNNFTTHNGILNTQLNSINNLYSGLSSISGIVVNNFTTHNGILNTQLNSINNLYSGLSSLSGIVVNNFTTHNGILNTQLNSINNLYSGLSSLSGIVVNNFTTHNGILNTQLNSINNLYSGLSSLSGIVVNNFTNHNGILNTQLNLINNLYSGLTSLSGIVYTNYLNSNTGTINNNIGTCFSGLSSLSGLVVGYHTLQNGYLNTQLNSINNAYSGLSSLSGLVVGYHTLQNGYLNTQLNSINNAYSGLSSLSGLVVGYHTLQNGYLQTQLNSINNAYSGLSSLSGLVVGYHTLQNGYLQTQLNSINNAYSGLSSLSGLVVGYHTLQNGYLQTQLNSINNAYSGLSSISGIIWGQYKDYGASINSIISTNTDQAGDISELYSLTSGNTSSNIGTGVALGLLGLGTAGLAVGAGISLGALQTQIALLNTSVGLLTTRVTDAELKVQKCLIEIDELYKRTKYLVKQDSSTQITSEFSCYHEVTLGSSTNSTNGSITTNILGSCYVNEDIECRDLIVRGNMIYANIVTGLTDTPARQEFYENTF